MWYPNKQIAIAPAPTATAVNDLTNGFSIDSLLSIDDR
ncbi:hypothetical protein CU002_1010 [Enterococcus faecium]|nr:hypothetical protein [Enterococcus faecium]